MAFADDSPSSSVRDLKKHDVFISFRGEDTRDNFTSHLHAALCGKQIKTYIDYRLERGDEVWPALVQAIKGSTVSLVIFSENYASSTWCLNEIVEIMECKKSGQHVIPVFYRVDPSHVRKQTGSYHTSFAMHERGSKHYHDMVHRWKDALFQAANLSGFDSRTYRAEADLTDSIIQMVLRKLNHKNTNKLRDFFIPDDNYACIESLLSTQSSKAQIIGIWGMGGIGKTAIASAIFQEFSPKYDGCCFLENIREESSRHGLSYIFNKLLCKLLQEDVHVGTLKIIPSAIMSRLKRKKVFIVLDDVNTSELLEDLLGVGLHYLGASSRVIVTTRDKHVLTSRAIIDQIYEVKEMDYRNSLKLFSLNAFNKFHPENEYWGLSKRAVAYAKGIPLALEVLGSLLRSKSENEWESELAYLKMIPNADIQKVLRWSFYELDNTEKNIFLDIACFFKGQKRGKVTRLLNACGFFADIGIKTLLDKALVKITMNNCIQMHDLIQEMGQKIVDEESIKSPGGRSRLWKSEEVRDILKNNKGTHAIESIFLDMTQNTDIYIDSQAFRKMPNLRLLAFADNIDFQWKGMNNTLCLPTNLELPNNLRYIQWDRCPLKSLPSSWPTKLVELSMPYSNVEKLWDGVQNLPNLEIIDLKCSKHMIECPNLSGAPNLKEVWLVGCDSLTNVHPSIFSLQKLEGLFVYASKALKSLCSNNCSPSLESLVAYDCPNLQEFSVPMLGDRSGIHLHLRSTALKQLPSSIFHLRNLMHFSFSISDSLMDLPSNFAYQIMLSDPTEHEYDTVITLRAVLPSPVFQSVRRLIFDGCSSLTELPDSTSLLSSLVHLNLYRCTNVISLPESINCLPQLQVLSVYQCEMLQLIPMLPFSFKRLRVWDCKSIKIVLSTITEPPRKDEGTFIFLNCINLAEGSYNTILKDAIARTELGANSPSVIETESHEEACIAVDRDCYVDVGEICYFLPVRGSKIHDLFDEHSTEAFISIKLPPNSNLSGFFFYLVLSQAQLCDIEAQILYNVSDLFSFGCECYLETSWGERVYTRSSSLLQWHWDQLYHRVDIMSDHALLWYDEKCCKKIMETVRRRKAINDKRYTYNANLTFKFFARVPDKVEAIIKECGIRWIYQNVEEGSGGHKSKKSSETYEREATAFQSTEEGVESDEQEKPIPLIRKFMQCFLEISQYLKKKLWRT